MKKKMNSLTDTEVEIGVHLILLIFPVPELMYISNGIFEFMDHNPEITVELILSTEPQNIIRNNIDLTFIVEDSFNENKIMAR